jgi:hypothetical protein
LLQHPLLQNSHDIRAQWCASQFPSLAQAPNVSAGSEPHIFALQRSYLTIAETSLDGKQQKCPIPPSDPSGCIGCGEQGGGLFLGKELHRPSFVAF